MSKFHEPWERTLPSEVLHIQDCRGNDCLLASHDMFEPLLDRAIDCVNALQDISEPGAVGVLTVWAEHVMNTYALSHEDMSHGLGILSRLKGTP